MIGATALMALVMNNNAQAVNVPPGGFPIITLTQDNKPVDSSWPPVLHGVAKNNGEIVFQEKMEIKNSVGPAQADIEIVWPNNQKVHYHLDTQGNLTQLDKPNHIVAQGKYNMIMYPDFAYSYDVDKKSYTFTKQLVTNQQTIEAIKEDHKISKAVFGILGALGATALGGLLYFSALTLKDSYGYKKYR